MASSTSGLSESSETGHALILYVQQRGRQRVAVRWVELEERLEDEAALGDGGVRHGQAVRIDTRVGDQQQVDVERTRRVARRVGVAPELDFDALGGSEQRMRIEVGLDRDACVQEVALPRRAIHRFR